MTGKEMHLDVDLHGYGALDSSDLDALIDEAIASDAYDEAVCSGQAELGGGCIGENHIETCPVLIAWQDRKAASEKRRGMR